MQREGGDRPLTRSSHRRIPVAIVIIVACLYSPSELRGQVSSPGPRPAPAAPASPAGFNVLAKEADAAREAGRLEEAIALYRKAVRLRPKWAEGYWYIGTSLYELGQYQARCRSSQR